MSTPTATVAHDFKAAFVSAIQTLYAADDTILVTFGHPGPQVVNYLDAIAFTDVQVEQEFATHSAANRPREETLRLTVLISSWRPGGADQEVVASAAAYGLLEAIERYARITDTTLGDTVRRCFLVSHTSTGETDPEAINKGRTIEIEATFEAKARIYG